MQEAVFHQIKQLIPKLSRHAHKGQGGKVGVLGGSFEYTGAPYYAGISALKTGADLTYIFCTKSAGTAIKSYNPELIVLPSLKTTDEWKEDSRSVEEVAASVNKWLDAVQSLVIGPGLSRDEKIQETAALVLKEAKKKHLPIVIDGDGLWLVKNQPDIIRGYDLALLTPNTVEYARLCEAILNVKADEAKANQKENLTKLAQNLKVTIMAKGEKDMISDGETVIECDVKGGLKRSGGQGDLLAGSVATFSNWFNGEQGKKIDVKPVEGSNTKPYSRLVLAAYAGSALIKTCSHHAFVKYGRSTTNTNLIEYIGDSFDHLFEHEEFSSEKNRSNL
jgi:ATP-dependent NAD(P)H-hydrate dehydratase